MPARSSPPSQAAAFSPLIAAGLIVALVFLAYGKALDAPFVLDDEESILGNATIRSLWPPWQALSPPRAGGLTVEGRPLLNLSLAFNYALGGTDPRGYRLTNIVIHLSAALLLFGLVRRTLQQPAFERRLGNPSLLASLVAAIWALHPLQTESVTYIIQRAESLCAVFYLLTLYAFVRDSGTAGGSKFWFGVSIFSCLLGMGAKEVMVSAPLIVLLYDRTFLSGGLVEAWRKRRIYYLSLAATWIVLAWLVIGFGGRSGSAGFHGTMSPVAYALTQCRAIILYLKLAIWPHPLVFDYGTELAANLRAVLPQAITLAGLLIATLAALRYRPIWGFLGAWFFALLAPSSSIVPVVTQTMAEHRVYLPLAAVVTALVLVADRWLGKRVLWFGAAVVLVFAGLTHARNEIYRTPLDLWTDTVSKRPDNTRALNNLALVLAGLGRQRDALAHYQHALRLKPGDPVIRNNYSNALLEIGRLSEALDEIDLALRHAPTLAIAHDTRGDVLTAMGRTEEAQASYRLAARTEPELVRHKLK
jgi:protein O-mannosyl-transferase